MSGVLIDNWQAGTIDDLRVAATVLEEEIASRKRIEEAAEDAKRAVEKLDIVIGRQDGDAWVQPIDRYRAYMKGAVVTSKTRGLVRSLIDWNTVDPDDKTVGKRYWEEVPDGTPGLPATNDTDKQAPVWVPGETVAAGMLRRYRATETDPWVTYRCIIGHTTVPTWEPPHIPALWERA